MTILHYERDLSITATAPESADKSGYVGKKNILVEANRENTVRINIAISVEPAELAPDQAVFYDFINPSEIKFYGAPKGKSIRHIFAYVASGTQKLNITGSDGAITFNVSPKFPKAGRVFLNSDEALNDSDKKLTVPAGKEYEITSIFVEFVATATVGNRILYFDVHDPSNDIIYQLSTYTVITASQTRIFKAIPAVYVNTASHEIVPLPNPLVLPAGFGVRVWDAAAVDAAADDMQIHTMIKERAV